MADIIARGLALGAQATADDAIRRIDELPHGIIYKGSVPTYADLPTNPNEGDAYTVEDTGHEYAWGNRQGTMQWIKLGGDDDVTKTYVDEQDTLLRTQITGVANDLAEETERATTAETTLSTLIADETAIARAAEEALASSITSIQGSIDTLNTIKQDKISVKSGSGLLFYTNQLDIDPEIISSVEYVDANITDTMNFIIQERNAERAGREAGDNLLWAALEDKQDTLIAGDNITIENNVISATSALWEAGTGLHSIQRKDAQCVASGDYSLADGYGGHAQAAYSKTGGFTCRTLKDDDEGIDARYARADGYMTDAAGLASSTDGDTTHTQNIAEHAQGRGNVSHKDSNNFGSAGNTLHSIGMASNNEDIRTFTNAVEVMQNGDHYIFGIGNYDGKTLEGASTLQDVINHLVPVSANPLMTPDVATLHSIKIDNVVYKIEGGSEITVDEEFNPSSLNPIANKAIAEVIGYKAEYAYVDEQISHVKQVPTGGTTGQVLTKNASGAGWADVNALPDGGNVGQVLTKGSAGAVWDDIHALPSGGTTGQFLHKTANGEDWRNITQVPAVSSTVKDYVLTVNADGTDYTWRATQAATDAQIETVVAAYLQTHYENGNTQEY